MRCRFCKTELTDPFADLVNSPPSNSFLTQEQLNEPEAFYPLMLYVCKQCFLVQIDEYKKSDEIFDKEYVYFSSFSASWLKHAKAYVDMIAERLRLDASSHVIEIASNDGYLLQYFKEKSIPCLGIEPAENTAQAAREKGIEVITKFFGKTLGEELVKTGKTGDLLIGNNVLAHVPDINDFVAGLKLALNPGGVVTMEFPHLMKLVALNQFDTIYHEHFSYLSLHTVETIFAAYGLTIFDVDEIPTHGGSLRIYVKHTEDSSRDISIDVKNLKQQEADTGMLDITYYQSFQQKINAVKDGLLRFLLDKKQRNQTVIGYGAAAKGNTLLNYCGVKKDLIPFVVDASPHKQGKNLPGVHIPVVHEDEIRKLKPDFVLILPWNLKSEICQQLSYIRDWNGQFVVPIPAIEVF